ncbi:LytTR family transcriptional regulator DNA-binding domain-containing protein [Chengkuizengella sediminis]|uniref:LytTR family transcriptional regulator DNA-binding domain-containing protein n=1 Tax=Chengkuizengella sediminis TaxID=1885917 RepID=UPI0013895805|nr:LytTR family transcriptional regulator DNA-binding domain-containing protein [Chengkuizengella sediminis]NDI35327.1 ATP-binding cassette domain-containing protein [Chengkuizengella sediminis]
MSILNIKQLEKNMGNSVLFPAIDLEIHRGEVVAIQCNREVGSKLIQLMIGELPVSSGEILFFSNPLNKNFKSLSKRIGIVFVNENLYERLTAKQYLHFYKQLYEVKIDINPILEQVGLLNKSKVKISRLTFSEKKRLHFARVLVHQPDLIILEEPDQNVDIESRIIIQKVINEFVSQEGAVLITTSYLESAIMMTNHIYHLNDQGLKKLEVMDEEDNVKDEKEENSTEPNISKEDSTTPSNMQVRFEKIPAKVDEKIILFDPMEIDFVESSEGISHLHVKGEVFPCTYTLNDLLSRLQPFGFFRCHRSYIVNLQKVREVITWTRNSYSLVLDDSKKSSIPLSKGKLTDLKGIIGF